MPVKIVKAKSPEIKKNIAVVRKMTRGMSFDENMGNGFTGSRDSPGA